MNKTIKALSYMLGATSTIFIGGGCQRDLNDDLTPDITKSIELVNGTILLSTNKMIRFLIIVFLFFTFQLKAFGQEEKLYISAKAGVPFYNWDSDKNFDMLTTRNFGMWALGLSIMQEKKSNWGFGLDLTVNRFAPSFVVIRRDLNLAFAYNSLPTAIFQISPVVRKSFHLRNSKLGFQASLALPLAITHDESYKVDHEHFLIWRRKDNGDYLNNIILNNSYHKIQNRFNVLLRPEIGIFYKLNERQFITLDAQWGIKPGGDIITRELNEIVFEGTTYQSTHRLSGNFTAVMLGYTYRLK